VTPWALIMEEESEIDNGATTKVREEEGERKRE
jgi:hypothetical protein